MFLQFDTTAILGSGLSITQLIDTLTRTNQGSFGYFGQLVSMLQKVSTTSIRSVSIVDT